MPVPATTQLSAHFSAAELGADNPEIPDQALVNLETVLDPWLEALRAIVGAPVIVDATDGDGRGYRTPAHNAAIGGDPHSDHPNGLAADFDVEGLNPYQVYLKLKTADAAGQLPDFDQLIWYVGDNHIHVGLGAGMRREWLLKTTEGSYAVLVSGLVSQLRGWV